MRLKVRRYIVRNLIAWDMAVNVAFGGELETMSDSLHRHQIQGNRAACILCKLLNIFEDDHCRKAKERNLKRMREALAADGDDNG